MGTLNNLSATLAAEGIRNHKFTSEQLITDCLNRIETRETDVRAWSYIDSDFAIKQARKADESQRNGEILGPLHGIPVGIKDVIDTKDMPTENGSPLFDGRRPEEDATCVDALKTAGAIIIGKTVTTELANLTPSRTRNPHNIEHSPGGSSAGSGASVADYHVPLAVGTQTGGSVIRPASFNGTYGLKPTLGLIPRKGILLQSHTLDTLGVYARSLQDIALITGSISIAEAHDRKTYTANRDILLSEYSKRPSLSPNFAFLETPAWTDAHPAAKDAISIVTHTLGEKCRKENLSGPFENIIDLHATVFAAENAYYYGKYLKDQPALLSKMLRDRLESRKNTLASDYIAALQSREAIYESIVDLLGAYDAIICLSAPGPAPAGFETTGSAVFNGLWTYLGVPCLSLPVLSVDNMPLGLQLVGKRCEEGKLFRTARWLEEYLIEHNQ